MTLRLEQWIGRESLRRTFSAIAEDTGVDEKTVRNTFRDYVNELEAQVRFEANGDVTGIDSAADGAEPESEVDPSAPSSWPQYTDTCFSVDDEEYANSNGIGAWVEVEAAADPSADSGNHPDETPEYYWGNWATGGTVGNTQGSSNGNIGATSTWSC